MTIRARMRARELPGAAVPAVAATAGRRTGAGRLGAVFFALGREAAFFGVAFFGAAFFALGRPVAFGPAVFFGTAFFAVGAVRGRGEAPFAPDVRRGEGPLPPDRRSVTGAASLRRGW
ncbi:hypothetical protein O9K63_02270 [Janibacter cremeus]|uniref:hypothetical protein n=1 Tax=Janibacter cremeus TaxID=1285192 RepID=UPI0023F75C6D|nr:hypothetical protein [Janibacter cremeus]WEV78644.1 hypothetical protein O9K63_02270 [Janibacter cremeus]